MIKTYYQLTKPGIIYGNAITAAAGFFLAAKGQIYIATFLGLLLGSSLVIASACVVNNYIDRDIDAQMTRTKNRALAKGSVSGRHALIYALLLGISGIGILTLFTNSLTVLLGLTGFFSYVVVYTFSKRKTLYATLLGSISGAMPIVAGYTSVTNRLDAGAMLLFFILCFWQMPHFYAIAIYRIKDYTTATIPVLPVVKGTAITKIHILGFIIAFTLTCVLLTFAGYTGRVFASVMSIACIVWLWMGSQGLRTKDTTRWAKKMFLFSLVVIILLSLLLFLDVVLR